MGPGYVERPGSPWWTWFTPSLCVSVVHGAGVDEVARAVAPDPVQLASYEQAVHWAIFDTDDYNRHWTAVGEVDGAVFAWEDNGWNGRTPSVAAPLSAAGSLTSVFWNVNARYAFLHAVAGTVVREFDPLYRNDPSLEDGALPEEGGLVWWAPERPELRAQQPALELMARVCGLAPDPRWLDRPGVRFLGTEFS
jgi:hypothetical protein